MARKKRVINLERDYLMRRLIKTRLYVKQIPLQLQQSNLKLARSLALVLYKQPSGINRDLFAPFLVGLGLLTFELKRDDLTKNILTLLLKILKRDNNDKYNLDFSILAAKLAEHSMNWDKAESAYRFAEKYALLQSRLPAAISSGQKHAQMLGYQGRLSDAINIIQANIHMCAQRGMRWDEANGLLIAASLAGESKNLMQAEIFYRTAMQRYSELGGYEAAIDAIRGLCKLHQDHGNVSSQITALEELSDLISRWGESGEELTHICITQGKLALRNSDYIQAERALYRSLFQLPDKNSSLYTEILYYYASALAFNGNFTEAFKSINQGIHIASKHKYIDVLKLLKTLEALLNSVLNNQPPKIIINLINEPLQDELLVLEHARMISLLAFELLYQSKPEFVNKIIQYITQQKLNDRFIDLMLEVIQAKIQLNKPLKDSSNPMAKFGNYIVAREKLVYAEELISKYDLHIPSILWHCIRAEVRALEPYDENNERELPRITSSLNISIIQEGLFPRMPGAKNGILKLILNRVIKYAKLIEEEEQKNQENKKRRSKKIDKTFGIDEDSFSDFDPLFDED